MILKCDCDNSTADALYGVGRRPHVQLNGGGPMQEYMCEMCYYVRTKSQGLRTGEKSTNSKPKRTKQ